MLWKKSKEENKKHPKNQLKKLKPKNEK